LFAAIHDPEAVEIVAESLNSETARVRANAVEALESLTTPQVAGLIAPLFEPGFAPAQLLRIGKDTWDMAHPDTTTVIRQLITDPDVPWLRTIMTFALGEIGASLSAQSLFASQEIEAMLKVSLADPVADVRLAARAAQRMIAGLRVTDATQEEETVLSTIERIIFLKGVPFFQSMTVDQLRVLADICEEELYADDTKIFDQGDPGGALYVVVSGRVAIERAGQRKGSFVRLATIEAHSCFGEMSLLDKSPRSAAATVIQDTLTLRLRREPLVALVRQYPDLAMELINVLSQRLRAANDRIAGLTRSRPRELQKLYDKFD
jgi:CRP/FNR family cyclic AMP-dependent transcriptional regulator